MEKKQKSSCGCFSFLRRKSGKTQKPDKSESLAFIQEQVKDDQVQSSMIRAKPRVSSIVPPLASRQSFFPAGAIESISNFSYTGETSATRQTNPAFDQMSSLAKTSEKISANETNENIEMNKNPALVPKIEENRTESLESLNVKEAASKEAGNDDKAKNPHLLLAPGLSPDWLVGSKFASPALASIGLSPVRMEEGEDECSDVEGFVRTAGFGQRRQVPDIFIRSSFKQSCLPVIKPTTPAFFTKRRPIQIFRQEKVL